MKPHRENEEGKIMSNWWEEQQTKARKNLMEYRAGHILPSRYDSLILEWGEAHLLEAQPDIESFLTHSKIRLRCQALHALARFGLQEYWPIAVNFLLYDPDYAARIEGASALGWLQNNTQDHHTLGVLASVVKDPYDDDGVRWDAYRSMRIVAHGDWKALEGPDGQHFELDRDADWNFINASVDSEQEKLWHEEAQRLLVSYQAGQVAETDYYAMLRRCARAHLQESHEVVRSFLDCPSKLLCTAALATLILYLQVPGNWQMAVDLIEHDPDDEMRIKGIEWLGLLMKKTRDQKTLRVLYKYWMSHEMDLSLATFDAINKVYAGDFDDFMAAMEESQEQTE
jgi:hypothetical protein